jgi:hypothetical protein
MCHVSPSSPTVPVCCKSQHALDCSPCLLSILQRMPPNIGEQRRTSHDKNNENFKYFNKIKFYFYGNFYLVSLLGDFWWKKVKDIILDKDKIRAKSFKLNVGQEFVEPFYWNFCSGLFSVQLVWENDVPGFNNIVSRLEQLTPF